MTTIRKRTFDPHRQDFAPYGFECAAWKPDRMTRPDRHNEIELNFLPRSSLTYLFGGRRHTVPVGRLELFWAATPHQIVAYSGRQVYYSATVPLAWFLSWNLPAPFVKNVLSGGIILAPDSSGAPHDERLFAQWTRDFAQRIPENHQAAALEIEARVRRLAQSHRPSDSQTETSLPGRDSLALSKIEHMAAWIAQHFAEPVGLKQIGAAVDLHPNYAASLFQKTFGTTINATVTAYRIANAQRLLVSGSQKILNIALESGFNSLSRFNSAFRRECGCTPREYRQKHRDGKRV